MNVRVITASDLLGGDVVYLGKDSRWHRRLEQARLFTTEPAAKAALEDAAGQVIGPYVIEVATRGNAPPLPLRPRERFRASGPSNRFLGKQADQHDQDT